WTSRRAWARSSQPGCSSTCSSRCCAPNAS
ncbi:MAG: hypothetical protein AVDCRST_MAG91-3252, partial [uncultured Sphingomonadaceae bacterium]